MTRSSVLTATPCSYFCGLPAISPFTQMLFISHSTNYFDTFIEVAEDTKAESGTIPPAKDKKTVAEMQHDLISNNPYKFTSDDIFFQVFAARNDLTKAEYKQAREQFFSKVRSENKLETGGDSNNTEFILNADGDIEIKEIVGVNYVFKRKE